MTTIFTYVALLLIFFSMLLISDAQVKYWCIADGQFPEDVLMTELNRACSNGADCRAIQPGQTCFNPNTTKDHASYAFNSYFQRTRQKGGACFFNFAAVITTTDPSHDSCKFDNPP